jgi:crotonobetainyl-CoA:carnitine CoA-transferase CaiB-like acyl-CoA transferase
VRFSSSQLRQDNHRALVAVLEEIISSHTSDDWMEAWTGAGLIASPIQNLKEVAADPQAWANDYFLKTHCSEVDREVEIRGLPITLSKTPGSVETLGPELGQDTEILLMEMLGMEWERIEELKADGIIP